MAQIFVKYNPYRLETVLKVNGREVSKDSSLYKVTKEKRLQEWIGEFPEKLRDELNTVDFSLEFCGMALDWDDFKDAFEHAQSKSIIKISDMRFTAGKSDEDINDKIIHVFNDLQEGPIEDFRNERLLKVFNNVNNSIFPINVIATMSSGKSTLINALLGKKLMPSKNEACTATITEILDSDAPIFTAIAYDKDNHAICSVPELTYQVMNELNDKEEVFKIAAEGNIPFLDSRSTALMLVDTPGPNNSQNDAHKNTTYRAINNDSNNLILYVLNGTQLSTNDDASLLDYIAEQMKKGGKQMRDRFLFVVNKMDQFNPEEEDIEKALLSVREYLARHQIKNPQIFPCSAFTALGIRTYLADVDIDKLTIAQGWQLPIAARDTLNAIYKFIDYDSMHLEKYTTLSPSAQQELNFRLRKAIENNDRKEQALIHSGIYSIEAAITAYVKKYAKTKKIKDLIESFQEVLESNQVLAKAKTQVATDEKAAQACIERAETVRKKIADGNEATVFKKRIAELNPIPEIREKTEDLTNEAIATSSKIFRAYGETINSRDEATRLVNQFSMYSSDAMAKLTADLESIINTEIINTGERILMEYQEKLSSFDTVTEDTHLDFQTVDLIKGALKTMREDAEAWTSDEFAAETVQDIGEITYEEKTTWEKVGQEEEEVVVGSHEELVGTRKVKTGSHQEKIGTKTVKNPKKRWWRFFTPAYIEEDVYETVDDYTDEDVYKTVLDYKKIMRDVFEEKTEKLEKFTLTTALLQTALMSKMRQNLANGVKGALDYAAEEVENVKTQFSKIFAELDRVIAEKYSELEKCATDQSIKEAELQKNKGILEWLETCMEEINDIIDM